MSRSSAPTPMVRMNLSIGAKTREQIEELQRRLDAPTMGEVIRRAVALYDFATNECDGILYADTDKGRTRVVVR